MPVTAGFIGKFYVVTAAVDSNLWLLTLTLVVGSTIGLFYYLRWILVLFFAPASAKATAGEPARPPCLSRDLALWGIAVLIVWGAFIPVPSSASSRPS